MALALSSPFHPVQITNIQSLKNLKKITNCEILFLCRLCGPFVHLFHQVIDNSFPGSTIPSPPHIYHNLYKFDILGQLLQFHPTYIYDNLNIQKSESILWSFLVEWMNGFLWRLNSWYWLFVSISSWMNSWYSFYHCVSFFVWSPLLLFRVSKVSDNF